MRAGGGQQKGSAFERATGRLLSMWISHGQRGNLFARTVLSGGQYTNAIKRGMLETGIAGDLMANHPLAFDFMSCFNIECKHYADLNLEMLLFKPDLSFLGKVFAKTRAQGMASDPRLFPFVVAKQNMKPPVLLVDHDTGEALREACPARATPSWHELHRKAIVMFHFEPIMGLADPGMFLRIMKQQRNRL